MSATVRAIKNFYTDSIKTFIHTSTNTHLLTHPPTHRRKTHNCVFLLLSLHYFWKLKSDALRVFKNKKIIRKWYSNKPMAMATAQQQQQHQCQRGNTSRLPDGDMLEALTISKSKQDLLEKGRKRNAKHAKWEFLERWRWTTNLGLAWLQDGE